MHESSRSGSINTVVLAAVFASAVIAITCTAVTFELMHRRLAVQTSATESSTLPVLRTSAESSEYAIPDMIAKAIPAVVSVVISADVPIIERYYDSIDPFGDWFGGFGFSIPRERSIGTERREIGGGTGFFVSADGHLITNRHVVDTEGAEFSVVLNDGTTYPATVVAKDTLLDIAVLKVEAPEAFPYLNFDDASTLRLGEPVIAIGNALAEFPNSVSVGVISGLSRNIIARGTYGTAEALEGVIQTDAAINQGNSGGPLLNVRGEVVGVNVAMAGNSENIGFAIPAAVVKRVYESVAEFGEIVRPFLGVRYLTIDERVAKQNQLPVDYGILIVRGETRSELAVIPGSPADKAGLRENDIILEIDGKKIDGERSLTSLIRDYSVGATVTLTVYQQGKEKKVEVKLEKAPTE